MRARIWRRKAAYTSSGDADEIRRSVHRPQVGDNAAKEGQDLFGQSVLALAMARQTKDGAGERKMNSRAPAPTLSPLSVPPKPTKLFRASNRSTAGSGH